MSSHSPTAAVLRVLVCLVDGQVHFASGFLRAAIGALLWLAVKLENLRRRLPRLERRLRSSLRRLLERWRLDVGVLPPEAHRRACAWNRTPVHLEEGVVRLHVEQPLLGVGQLRHLAARVLGFVAARETVRRILIRNQHLVVELQQGRRRRRRRIKVKRAGELWGLDFTLVWVLGFFPAWVLGVVDYQGSRLVAFERVVWPTSSEVARVLSRAFAEFGAPERVLSDNGPQFRSDAIESFLEANGVRHAFIRPGHAWTNGRIERVFRSFKETVTALVWLVDGRAQLDRFCADFLLWHNRDRPHSSWGGRTPDEVFFGRRRQLRPLGRVDYFDGLLHWYRFGA
ncbi:MAG: transposase [Myxococcaceae bacterium]